MSDRMRELISGLMDELPPEAREKLSTMMARRAPEQLAAALTVLQTVNYDVELKITPRWTTEPQGEYEQLFRDRLREDVGEGGNDQPRYEQAMKDFLNMQDMERISRMSNLQAAAASEADG